MAELTHLQTASAWAALHARRNMRKKAFKWAVALCAGLTLVAAWTDSAAGARLTFRMVLPFLALYFGAGALREEIEDAEVELTTVVGRSQVRLSELLDFRPGDIIPCDFTGRVTVFAEDVPVLRGQFGVSRGQQSVKVEERLLRGRSIDPSSSPTRN